MKTVTKNISLTPDLLDWAEKKVGTGYNNISEVIREALRFKRQAEKVDYLNPPPLPAGVLEKIYREETRSERRAESRLARRSHQKPEPE